MYMPTSIAIGLDGKDELIEAEFSLSDRSDMKYPVLIGRKLLKGRFIVDVSRKNVSLKFNNKQKKNK